MAKRKGAGQANVTFNMTPMIDVTFQLIIFFIIAGQMASAALAELQTPKLHKSQAVSTDVAEVPNKVIVNVVSRDPDNKNPDLAGQALHIKVAGHTVEPDDIDSLAEIFEQKKEAYLARSGGGEEGDEFYVEIRAHYTVHYDEIEPVLMAAGQAEIPNLSITAQLATMGE